MLQPRPASTRIATGVARLCLAILLVAFAAAAQARGVPVLIYHSWWVQPPCDYAVDAISALQTDLETLHALGFQVVPLEWVAQWASGERSEDALPARAVALSFDDGSDLDWRDASAGACGPRLSVRQVLTNAQQRHPSLFAGTPWAASFVIGSPLARKRMLDAAGLEGASDDWWAAAAASPSLSIENHSLDHDHPAVRDEFDWTLGLPLSAVGGRGAGDFSRISTHPPADRAIRAAGRWIAQRSGQTPRHFAYPVGANSWFVREVYLPLEGPAQGLIAGWCVDEQYVTRGANRWCLPRFSHGGSWRDPAGLALLLRRAHW